MPRCIVADTTAEKILSPPSKRNKSPRTPIQATKGNKKSPESVEKPVTVEEPTTAKVLSNIPECNELPRTPHRFKNELRESSKTAATMESLSSDEEEEEITVFPEQINVRMETRKQSFVVRTKSLVEDQAKAAFGKVEDHAKATLDLALAGAKLARDAAFDAVDSLLDRKKLPDLSRSNTWKIIKTLMILEIISLVSHVWFFVIPLNPVDAGVNSNRIFLYVVVPLLSALGMAPWVQTFDILISHSSIPLKAKIISVLSGSSFLVLLNAIISEKWGFNVFPLPFTSLALGIPSLLVTLLVLFFMTPTWRDKEFRMQFLKVVLASVVFMISTILALLWAALVRKLQGNSWQWICSIVYVLLKTVCAGVYITTITSLCPDDYTIVAMKIEIVFSRVQVAVYPYVDNYRTSFIPVLASVISFAGSYYGIVDRFLIMIDMMMKNQDYFKTLKALWLAPICEAHTASMELHRDKKARQHPNRIGLIAERLKKKLLCQEYDSQFNSVSEIWQAPIIEVQEATMAMQLRNGETENSDDIDIEAPSQRKTSFDILAGAMLSPFSLLSFPKGEEIVEKEWRQRMVFSVIKVVGSESTTLMIRMQQLLSLWFIRQLPNNKYLNETYYVSDEMWRRSFIMGLILFCAHIGIFVMIGMLFKSCKLPDGQQLTMTGVLNYIYCGTDYACMFHGLWISASGMFMWSMMIDHFGSDFSFTFEWLKCMGDGEMAWPGCSS
eukprot:scaffold38709_cov56-Attheya_sp.AAC.2